MEINNHKPYSRCRVWWCDVTTSNSIQDGGALVVNILVFDLRVQLQHCTYQRKTLLFTLIKVSTFICKREISGLSSPLSNTYRSNKLGYLTKVTKVPIQEAGLTRGIPLPNVLRLRDISVHKLKKRAGNYWVIYIGPRVPHNFSH